MDVQLALRSDIAMALDDCTEHPATEGEAGAESMERSMRWAARSHAHYYRADAPDAPGGLFGIVQGGMHARWRLASLEALLAPRLAGPGGRGLASGSPRRSAWLARVAGAAHAGRTAALSHGRRPAQDIVAAVMRGIDLFDCVMPTRHARNGHCCTSTAGHEHPQQRLPGRSRAGRRRCDCYTCRNYSRAYLRPLRA